MTYGGYFVPSGSTAQWRPQYSNGGTPYVGVVGQGVSVGVYGSDGSMPNNCSWNLPANAVGDYEPYTTESSITPAPTSGNPVSFYFTAAGTGSITVSCYINGVSTGPITPASYTITAPSFSAHATYTAASLDTNYLLYPGENMLHWGQFFGTNPANGFGGINMTYSVQSTVSGYIGIFQLVDTRRDTFIANTSTYTQPNPPLLDYYTSTNGTYESDFCVPYASGDSSSTLAAYDSPAISLDSVPSGLPSGSFTYQQNYNDQFDDYFMFRPLTGIWVTLGHLHWGWQGIAQKDPVRLCHGLLGHVTCGYNGTGSWSEVQGPSVVTQAVATATSSLPQWRNVLALGAPMCHVTTFTNFIY